MVSVESESARAWKRHQLRTDANHVAVGQPDRRVDAIAGPERAVLAAEVFEDAPSAVTISRA